MPPIESAAIMNMCKNSNAKTLTPQWWNDADAADAAAAANLFRYEKAYSEARVIFSISAKSDEWNA